MICDCDETLWENKIDARHVLRLREAGYMYLPGGKLSDGIRYTVDHDISLVVCTSIMYLGGGLSSLTLFRRGFGCVVHVLGRH